MTNPSSGTGQHTGQTWQQALGTPGRVQHIPRPDVEAAEELDQEMVEYGGGHSWDRRYTTPRLDWTFESRNVGRHDGHMARIVVTRNETGLPWTDGWTEGDGPLDALMSAAMTELDQPRFPLGQVLATPGALAALESSNQNASDLLQRHVLGDWGDLGEEDKRTNDQALQTGARLLSAYRLEGGAKIWIITEADRSASTLLLPEEY